MSILLIILGLNYILESIAGYLSYSHGIENPFGRMEGLWGKSVIGIFLHLNDARVREEYPVTFYNTIGFMFAADVFTLLAPLSILLTYQACKCYLKRN